MRFPREKEVFFLRLLLLHFPKTDFEDCLCHNGRRYAAHEEVVIASGLLQGADEAQAVMQELVELHYSASKLRFAFLVLLEQDAKPWTLFNAFAGALMKDFCDRGMPCELARERVLQVLRLSWVQAGHDSARWPLAKDEDINSSSHHTIDTADLAKAQAAWQLLRRDPDQREAADAIMGSLKQGSSAFIFVQGRAGCGKSTVAAYTTYQARIEGFLVRNVATTGLAGIQLPDGATAHSVFKIPLSDEDQDMQCFFGPGQRRGSIVGADGSAAMG